jgi:hypothetical protein
MILVLLAAGCARAGSGPAATVALPVSTAGLVPVAGVAYRDRMPLMGRDVPLPPGDWGMLSVTTLVARGRVVAARVFMEQHAGSVATRVVSVGSTIAGLSIPAAALAGECQQSDVIDNRIRSADPTGEQDCLLVNFGVTAAIRAGYARVAPGAPASNFNAGAFTNMFNQLDIRNLTLPPTIVFGSVAFDHRGQALNAMVIYNPDADRVPPDPSPLRSTNGWAPFNLDRDPAKKAYVARVLTEMEAYRLLLLDALDRPVQPPDAPKQRSTSLPVPPAG